MRPLHLLAAAALLPVFSLCRPGTPDPLACVDPNIGGVSVLLQPTRPLTHLPGQVIRWTPSRADLLDETIGDYPLTLTSHRLHSVFGFLPLPAAAADGQWWTDKQLCEVEKTTPYRYDATLQGCSISFTPGRKSAMITVSWTGGEGGLLRFRPINSAGSFALIDDHTLAGEEAFAGLKAYCRVEFDHPVRVADARPDGSLLLSADAPELRVRYGVSYIDADQAEDNLHREIAGWEFDSLSRNARDIWSETLGRIELDGGTAAHRRMFYTALYRCSERMVDISENGRYFSAFDKSIHSSDTPFWTDNWLWDTHIALEPLQMILNPAQEEQKIGSYIEMYRQSGAVPSFATIFGDWPAMTGNYAAVWFADALSKGLQFDVEAAYEGVRHNALEETMLPWRNGPRCSLDDFYDAHGWFPALWPGEKETEPRVDTGWERRQAVSLSTAFAYSDWACARLAASLGRIEDERMFMERSQWYRNVYRADKGMFWPRDKEGRWIEGVDPRYMDRAYFTENNAYTFQWDVKHDLEGLFSLMGGHDAAEHLLDTLFRIPIDMPKFEFYSILPDATGMVGQFAMGNEPSFHIPYLYDYTGSPWKTQRLVHRLVDQLFSDGLTGVPGDEDGGAMSAFLVFTMMGFFPVTPGLPEYALGSPFFPLVKLHLPDGKTFTIRAKNFAEDRPYVTSAVLDGKALERPFLTHSELMAGGTLELTMSEVPDTSWGAGS